MNFGSVNFQPRPRLQKYVPAPAARNRWDTDWTRRWFYHTVSAGSGVQSHGGLIELIPSPTIVLTSREEALLLLLLNATKRLSTRDLVEEFCAFRVWPLSRGWSVTLGAPRFDLPSLTMPGDEGAPREGV